MNKDEIAGLVKYARDWPGVEGDALSAGVVGQKLNDMADALTTLSAERDDLQRRLDNICLNIHTCSGDDCEQTGVCCKPPLWR